MMRLMRMGMGMGMRRRAFLFTAFIAMLLCLNLSVVNQAHAQQPQQAEALARKEVEEEGEGWTMRTMTTMTMTTQDEFLNNMRQQGILSGGSNQCSPDYIQDPGKLVNEVMLRGWFNAALELIPSCLYKGRDVGGGVHLAASELRRQVSQLTNFLQTTKLQMKRNTAQAGEEQPVGRNLDKGELEEDDVSDSSVKRSTDEFSNDEVKDATWKRQREQKTLEKQEREEEEEEEKEREREKERAKEKERESTSSFSSAPNAADVAGTGTGTETGTGTGTREVQENSEELYRSEPVTPAAEWAQSRSHVFVSVKFAHKIDAPACIDLEKEDISIEENTVRIRADCKGQNKRFLFDLDLFQPIVPGNSTWQVGSVGRGTLTLEKATPDTKWVRLIKSQTKPRNLHMWWSLVEKYEEEMEQVEEEEKKNKNKKTKEKNSGKRKRKAHENNNNENANGNNNNTGDDEVSDTDEKVEEGDATVQPVEEEHVDVADPLEGVDSAASTEEADNDNSNDSDNDSADNEDGDDELAQVKAREEKAAKRERKRKRKEEIKVLKEDIKKQKEEIRSKFQKQKEEIDGKMEEEISQVNEDYARRLKDIQGKYSNKPANFDNSGVGSENEDSSENNRSGKSIFQKFAGMVRDKFINMDKSSDSSSAPKSAETKAKSQETTVEPQPDASAQEL